MDIDVNKIAAKLDLLRLRLNQQRDLTEELTKLYIEINVMLGTPIDVPVDQKTKAKAAWGADPNYVKPPVSPESQVMRDHVLSRDW